MICVMGGDVVTDVCYVMLCVDVDMADVCVGGARGVRCCWLNSI